MKPEGIETSISEGCRYQANFWADEEYLDLGFGMEMRLY